MANRRKPSIDLAHELGPVIKGDSLETLMDLARDPGAWQTPGALARIGAAFTYLGNMATEAAKESASLLTLAEDDGVFFTVKGPSTQTRVNTRHLKDRFPAVNYPEMWQTISVKGSVAVDLPFTTKEASHGGN